MKRPPRSLCAAAPHPASRDQPSAVLRPSAWCSLPPRGRSQYLSGCRAGTDMAQSTIPAHGGERVAAALAANGVRVVFTLCGGHISPILVAAKRLGIRIVDTRDEATAVFAADAVARLTGTPGVAAVTAGPGLTNTITALKNAQLAQSPVVLIGGAAPTALQGRGALQDIDQKRLVAPHVKLVKTVRRVADLGPAVEEALAVAREGVPGPVFVECPVDLLYDEKVIRGWYDDAGGKGTSIPDRLLRWYLKRHANRMFAGSGLPYQPAARHGDDARGEGGIRGPGRRGAAPRPSAADDSRQPDDRRRRRGAAGCRGGAAAGRASLPVGDGARRPRARRRPPDAPCAPQGAARSGFRAARGGAVRLPARLRQACAALGNTRRRQPQPQGRAPQPQADDRGDRRRGPLHRRACASAWATGRGATRGSRASPRATPSASRKSTRRRERPAST